MHGLLVMYRKELEDHFSSTRFVLLLTVILMISLVTTYMVGTGLRKELEGFAKPSLVFLLLFTSTGALFSLVQFIAFFGPLIGMILGFDAISRERSSRTLSKLLSQPIYRDAVINGKFLAGLTIVSLMLLSIVLLISGMGLWVLGVVPGWEEVGRLIVYLVVSIVYIGFWLAVSILFSILFRGMATSALASLALWIFLAFFMALGASLASDLLSPIPPGQTSDPEVIIRHEQTRENAVLFRRVPFDTQAAGFFTADNDGFALHQRADVFEADGRFVDFYAENFGHGVHLMTCGHGAHHRTGPAAVFLQMIQRQRENLVRRQPGAVFVHNAEAVGVTVEAETDLRLAAADELADVGHIRGIGFRMMPAK